MGNQQPSPNSEYHLKLSCFNKLMGFIYKIEAPNKKTYVGQTIHTTEKRWKEHIIDAYDAKKNKCKLLNASIRKYGKENFIITTIEECLDTELNEREIYNIHKFNSLHPNGLNLKIGGSNGKHIEEVKNKIRNSLIGCEVPTERRLKISASKKQNELPMYIIHFKTKGSIIGYRVCNHPNKGEKKFINSSLTLEENLKNAKSHLTYLNSLERPLLPKLHDLQHNISRFKTGFRVRYNGYEKAFISSKLSTEENYNRAIVYLNDIKDKDAVQRLDGSGWD